MKIIDAHMHLPVNFPSLCEKKNALLAEMKQSGVCHGIVISDSEISSDIGSLEECAELFDGCGEVDVIGGISPFIDYAVQLEALEKYIAGGSIVGIKIYSGHEPVYPSDGRLEPVYETARRYDVPLLFHTGWSAPEYTSPEIIRKAAKAHADVTVVCCHCCYPNLAECFGVLAECPNVYFDISSLAEGGNSVKAVLENAIHISPDRFIFGSDYGCCGQAEHIGFALSLNISEYERERLMYGNAVKIYGIKFLQNP